MRPAHVFVVFACAVFVTAQIQTLLAGAPELGGNGPTFEWCEGGNRLCARWSVNASANLLYLQLGARGDGWFGFGTTTTPRREGGGRAWMAWVDDSGAVRAATYTHGDGIGAWAASGEALVYTGRHTPGVLQLTLTYPLSSASVITLPQADAAMIWAISADAAPLSSPPAFPEHELAGAATINFYTGAASDDITLWWLLPALLFPVVTALGGFIMLRPAVRRSACGMCCLLRPIKASNRAGPRPRGLASWTWAEFIINLWHYACVVGVLLSVGYTTATQQPWAIAMGHMSAFTLATSLLPSARNSIVTAIFGMSAERALRFHRQWGQLTFFCMMIHGIMQAVYRKMDVFSVGHSASGEGPLFGFIAFCVFFIVFWTSRARLRRWWYELFFNIHLTFSVGVLFAAIHNRVVIYYLVIPMVLHIADHGIRAWRTRKPFPVKACSMVGDKVMRLTLETGGYEFEAGAYVYIADLSYSKLQWHPYSIASAPGNKDLVLVLKSMGAGTFSEHVAQQVKKGIKPTIYADGPYGTLSVPLRDYELVLLIAGGVGVTPMAGVFNDMRNNSYPRLKFAKLVWLDRSPVVLRELLPELRAVQEQQAARASAKGGRKSTREVESPEFAVDLYCTTTSRSSTNSSTSASGSSTSESASTDAALVPIGAGRPDWEEVFDGLLRQYPKTHPDRVAVLCCGPSPMQAIAQLHAQRRGFHYHMETFLF